MSTPADAVEIMNLIAACHHRTAPRMDDRAVVLATAVTWAELFSEYRLSLADLVAGVKKRALTHADAPEPAEIIQFAREIRRERDAKQGPSAEYEALCEAKGADTQELANKRRLNAIVTEIAERKAPESA